MTVVVALCLGANPTGAKQPDKDAATGRIILDGRYIEMVTLQRKDGEMKGQKFELPGINAPANHTTSKGS